MATERVVPAVRPAHRPEAKAPILSTPARATLLLGASAAVYAVTLTGMSGLQAQASAATAAERASGLDAVAGAHAANDRLEATVDELDAGARQLVVAYGTTADHTSAYQARLDALASLVAEVQGTAATLPARIQLPTVTLHGAISAAHAGAPAHARSGGSGVKP